MEEVPQPATEMASVQEHLPLHEPWKTSWSNLQGQHLDRGHRHIAWQLLHGTLPCGALQAYRTLLCPSHPKETLVSAVQNANCAFCEGQLHTFSHIFFACPKATQIWTWAAKVWAAATTLPVPEISLALVLLDDRRGWNSPREAAALWTDIRIVVLAGLYSTSEQRRRGLPVSEYTIAAHVVHHLRGLISRDWQRTVLPDDPMAVTSRLAQDICCTSWLRGRRPRMEYASFMEKWGKTDALCRVIGGKLKVDLSLQHPLAFTPSA